MTPVLRRLAVAATVILGLTGLAAFAVGRASRPSEHEALVSRVSTEKATFRAAERESFARAEVRGHTAGTEHGRRAGHLAGKAHAKRVVRARAAAVAVAPAPAAPMQAASSTGTSGDSAAEPSGGIRQVASAFSGQSKASGSSSSSGAGSEPRRYNSDGSSGSGSGTSSGGSASPAVTATRQRRSPKLRSYLGTSSPASPSSSPVTYRQTRTTRWRSEWRSSASGTTNRYSAKTTTSTTITSGGATRTRVRTMRTSWSSSS